MTPRAIANYAWVVSFTGAMSTYTLLRQVPRRDRALFQKHTRAWARGVARGVGLEVEAYGTWRLDPEGTYVLMANHQSHVDIPTLFVALPMIPGFLAKAELRRVPLFGRAMEVGGHVFVDRAQRGRAVEAIAAAAEAMREVGSIMIFPEGTRSHRREVMPFKKGGFHLAKQAGVPLVPIGIRNTADILPKHGKSIVPGRVEVHVGEPIPFERVRELEMPDLIADVRGQIAELAELPLADDRSGAR